MIYFDLDNVLRDLQGAAGYWRPREWNERMPNGKSFCDYIDENLHLLLEAQPTEYYPVIMKLDTICVITSQPKHWRENTSRWIRKHLGGQQRLGSVSYVDKPEEKLALLGPDDILVDDYPYFSSYEKVWLIEESYNSHVKSPLKRIFHKHELSTALKEKGLL